MISTQFEQQFGQWVGSEHIVRQVYSDKQYQRITDSEKQRLLLGQSYKITPQAPLTWILIAQSLMNWGLIGHVAGYCRNNFDTRFFSILKQ